MNENDRIPLDAEIAPGAVFRALRGRLVRVVSGPRRIAGGEVARVTWAFDDAEASLQGHPAHRVGFEWEEPVLNLRVTDGGCAHKSETAADGWGAYCRFCGETLA